MKSGCFGNTCEETFEGDSAEEVADAFVAHVAAAHDWPVPEEALRNYARNFAEAGERLAGAATERVPEIGIIEVHPVTEDRIDDWLAFFDRDGFAGNPEWASCYCLENHDPAPEEMPERLWSHNRSAMAERLRTGTARGYLAYVDGITAGWVNASRRADYTLDLIGEPDGIDPSSVVGVSCFVISPPYRRHGVAAALLDHVIGTARERGVSWVEGYPRTEPEDNDAGHFRGPKAMYDAKGFETVKVRERDTVMRRQVI